MLEQLETIPTNRFENMDIEGIAAWAKKLDTTIGGKTKESGDIGSESRAELESLQRILETYSLAEGQEKVTAEEEIRNAANRLEISLKKGNAEWDKAMTPFDFSLP